MKTFSYTVTPLLQQHLKSIEMARQRILLHPLSQEAELNLRWQAHAKRIYYSLHLAHHPVTEKEITKALVKPERKTIHPGEKDIIQYKRAFDYIARTWFVTKKPIMPQTIQLVYKTLTGQRLPLSDTEVVELLVFLQTSSENPFIQSFIGYTQFSQLLPDTDESGKFIRLLPYIFLYKSGLDFRGLLVLEAYFYKNERLLRELPSAILRQESITVWIEHFIEGIGKELEDVYQNITQGIVSTVPASFLELTERQKEILEVFDQPGTKITNKRVQQFFHISQITASRDLAHLSSLGLLFPYGKGRAVYYMRV